MFKIARVLFQITIITFSYASKCKIVDGVDTDISEVPYQVSLQNVGSNYHTCGGSIIAPKWILTAAHCVKSFDPTKKQIVVGMTRKSEGGIVHTIRRAIKHPLYGSQHSYSHDIAIVELNSRIEFNTKAQPIRLPKSKKTLPMGKECTVQGWGRLDTQAESPDVLQMTTLLLWKPEKCATAYKYPKSLFVGSKASMLCAGKNDGVTDTCKGDSGGGLVCNGILYGVVSFGKGCANPDFPKVFSHVYNLRNFIKEYDVSKYDKYN